MIGRVCLWVLTVVPMLNVVESVAPAAVRAAAPIQSGWEIVPQLLAQSRDPQGSIGKWPGGHIAPSVFEVTAVLLLLAGAVVGFILYARKQKETERRAIEKLRRDRNQDGERGKD